MALDVRRMAYTSLAMYVLEKLDQNHALYRLARQVYVRLEYCLKGCFISTRTALAILTLSILVLRALKCVS